MVSDIPNLTTVGSNIACPYGHDHSTESKNSKYGKNNTVSKKFKSKKSSTLVPAKPEKTPHAPKKNDSRKINIFHVILPPPPPLAQ